MISSRLTAELSPEYDPPGTRADSPGQLKLRRGRRMVSRLLIGGLVLAAATGAGYYGWTHAKEIRTAWASLVGPHAPHKAAASEPSEHEPSGPWDGFVTADNRSCEAIGLCTVVVGAQSKPIRLELLGTTAYMTDTLTKIRPMFKSRVDKVHVSVGQQVTKGAPLIELYSKDLAEAKSAYQVEHIQWIYDKNLLQTREPLAKSNAISHQLFAETKNNEMKSHREYEVARDKLLIYGLTEEEVGKVESEVGAQKARITLRSPTSGFVIERDVVPGNLYDEHDTLLVIAPLERLWVWGNVFERDLNLVKLDQSWEVRFPYLGHHLQGKVEYISNRVDPDSHAVRIRTSIPNPGGQLKADMLVRGMLEIPPTPGRTVVPRTSLVVDDGFYYVFVRVPGRPDKFERRRVEIAQETDDQAIVDRGLKVGDEIVSVGALILSQIYEDTRAVQTGAPPPKEHGGE